jgi:hypothetical protein
MMNTTIIPNANSADSGSPDQPDELDLWLLEDERKLEEASPPLDDPPPPALAN